MQYKKKPSNWKIINKLLQETEECRQHCKKENIIIKSRLLANDPGTEIENKAKEILQKIDCKEEFTWTTYMGNNISGKGMITVQLNTLKDKINIMKKKSKLHGEDTFIENYMTKIEREIQKTLKSCVKDEREKGNTAKVGYQKILINDQWVY